MDKRTAILFAGSAYNIRFSLQSQLQNLILPNNADVFVLTTRACKRRKTPKGEIPLAEENDKWNTKNATTIFDTSPLRDDEIQLIKDTFGDRLKAILIAEELPDYMSYVEEERKKMMNAINAYIDQSKRLNLPPPFRGMYSHSPDHGTIRCIVDQYRHIRKCYQMMEEYENQHGFKYDYVMRARIDFIVPFEFNISHYYLNHDQPYLYVCGNVRSDHFEWMDEYCFFSRRDTAAKLFPRLDMMGLITNRKYNTVYEKEDNDFMFDPETQFSLLLHEIGLTNIVQVKIYRSALYTNGGDYDYFNYKFRREIKIDHEYKLVCECETDINEHIPILKKYADKCNTIVECGVRYGNSTVGFLQAINHRPEAKLISYDPQWNDKIDYIELIAKENDLNFEMKIELPFNNDKTESTIPECDLLFIDTNHNVESIKMDIELHSPKCKRWMILHDTSSFWERGQGYDNGGGGMKLFLEPFLQNSSEWIMKERFFNNNGLMILERINGN